jgi:hypothetical protein
VERKAQARYDVHRRNAQDPRRDPAIDHGFQRVVVREVGAKPTIDQQDVQEGDQFAERAEAPGPQLPAHPGEALGQRIAGCLAAGDDDDLRPSVLQGSRQGQPTQLEIGILDEEQNDSHR